ncbi:hypothetical protein JEM67_11120 [Serratia sp. PAMC26656]|uniref:hypothetical protein n=1 Tax=Serratia sp. PAMC26656 TaxID=2775909 RepID=UPI0018F3E8E0|nr:hypothetical protein [Serratia sp. PAMC26656]MBJ7892520.1 hypothetical protein [Serratia sp. PAMC26656]
MTCNLVCEARPALLGNSCAGYLLFNKMGLADDEVHQHEGKNCSCRGIALPVALARAIDNAR